MKERGSLSLLWHVKGLQLLFGALLHLCLSLRYSLKETPRHLGIRGRGAIHRDTVILPGLLLKLRGGLLLCQCLDSRVGPELASLAEVLSY